MKVFSTIEQKLFIYYNATIFLMLQDKIFAPSSPPTLIVAEVLFFSLFCLNYSTNVDLVKPPLYYPNIGLENFHDGALYKEYLLMGGISILIGILILYGNALFGAYMEITGSAGPNTIAEISSLLLRNCLLCSWIDFYCFFFFKNKVKLQSVGVFILPPLIVS